MTTKITDPDTVATCKKMVSLIDEGYTFAHSWHVLTHELPAATQVVVSMNLALWLEERQLGISEETTIQAMREIGA